MALVCVTQKRASVTITTKIHIPSFKWPRVIYVDQSAGCCAGAGVYKSSAALTSFSSSISVS